MDARTAWSALEIRQIKRCVACSEEGRRLVSLFNGPKLNNNPELLQHIIASLDLDFVQRTEFPRLFVIKRIDSYFHYRQNARAVASPQGNNEKRTRV